MIEGAALVAGIFGPIAVAFFALGIDSNAPKRLRNFSSICMTAALLVSWVAIIAAVAT